MKKNVLISFITEADTDLEAVFNLNKVFLALPESDLVKFDTFDVLDVEEVSAYWEAIWLMKWQVEY